MTADQLRRLAVLIERTDHDAIDRAAGYLRACADALDAGPVAWKKEWPNGSVNLWDGQNKPPLDIIGETRPLYPIAMPGALQLPEPMGYAAGIEAVAAMIEAKARAFADQYGADDMGSLSFGSGNHAEAKTDYHNSLVELAEEVRAMIDVEPTPPPSPVQQDDPLSRLIRTSEELGAYRQPSQDDEALEVLRLALDALTCDHTGDDIADSHRCGRCDENVDRNASVRQRIRALLTKRGAA